MGLDCNATEVKNQITIQNYSKQINHTRVCNFN